MLAQDCTRKNGGQLLRSCAGSASWQLGSISVLRLHSWCPPRWTPDGEQ